MISRADTPFAETPPADTSHQDAALALNEALRPLLRRLSAERTLSLGKVGVLGRLADQGRATASALSVAERISPQAVTIVVRELEALGLIARTPDQEDRRRVWIELTDAGRSRLAEERAAGHGWLGRAIEEGLDAGERSALAAAIPVLAKLGATADAGAGK